MAKKTVKSFPAKEEKKSTSLAWIPIAIIVVLFLAVMAWFLFFSNSNPSDGNWNEKELVGNGYIKGNPDAKVTVVEFSDFQCPACGAAFPTVESVFSQYQDRIRLVYRHFPLTTIHPFAVSAAEASECAAEQNNFWEMHNALFQQQPVWTATNSPDQAKQNIRSLAQQTGLNMDSFDQCLSSRKEIAKVQEDMDTAIRLGLDSTPTFFVNGKKLSGAVSVDYFSREIDAALAKAK